MVKVYIDWINEETGEVEKRVIATYTEGQWRKFKGYHKGMEIERD